MTRVTLAALSLTALLSACQQPAVTSPPAPPAVLGAQPTPDIAPDRVAEDARTGQRYVTDQLVVGLGGAAAEAVARQVGGVIIDRLPQLDVVVLRLLERDSLETARELGEQGRVQFASPQQVWRPEPYTRHSASPDLGALAVNQVFDGLPQ